MVTDIAPKRRGRPTKSVDPTTPGGRLQALRIRSDLSQDDLASVLGVNRSMVSKYEDGRHDMGPEILQRAAKRFNVTPSWILFEDVIDYVRREAPLMGRVGAGNLVEVVPDESGQMIDVPSNMDDANLYKVEGDSCFPIFEDGDLIGVRGGPRLNPAEFLHRMCVVEIEDGSQRLSFVKRVRPGAVVPGMGSLFNLESPNPEAEPLDNKQLLSARPVVLRIMSDRR